MLLLTAGHETTANMIGLGAFALLQHPDQAVRLREREDPGLAQQAVEELLRCLSVIHIGPGRVATEDVELGGQVVRAGESVTVSVPVANRDPDRFPDPDRLDLARSASGHLAFGPGSTSASANSWPAWSCRGVPDPAAPLPRPAAGGAARGSAAAHPAAVYGVHRLPVRWLADRHHTPTPTVSG